LKLAGASYRVDETYIKVGKNCKYLYRAVDSMGNTIEFLLSAVNMIRKGQIKRLDGSDALGEAKFIESL
jgi:hypothetical protein